MLKKKKKFTIDFNKAEIMLFENQTVIVKGFYKKNHGNLCTIKYVGSNEKSARILFTNTIDGKQEIILGNSGITEVVLVVNSTLKHRLLCVFCNYPSRPRLACFHRSKHQYYVYDINNPTVKYLKNRLTDETILIGDTAKKPDSEPIVKKKKSIFKRLNK